MKKSNDRGYGMYTAGAKHFMGPEERKPPLGSGGRFQALEHSLEGRKGVKDPKALAAAIGRKKYGAKRFQALAAKGKK